MDTTEMLRRLTERTNRNFRFGDVEAAATAPETTSLPEPDQLAALVDSMRTSAQETLDALRRRGFVIARVSAEEGR